MLGDGPTAHITAADKQVSEVMQEYWTNFAKSGNPNGGHFDCVAKVRCFFAHTSNSLTRVR